jgi:transposase
VEGDRAAFAAAGRLRTHARDRPARRRQLDLYIAQTGCQWRLLPKDFPPYTTVQRYFHAWRDSGVWQTINHVLLMDVAKPPDARQVRPPA